MNPVPRKMEKTDQDLINEYLKKGGVVTKSPAFQRTEDITYTSGFYGRKKKTTTTETKSDEE